MNHSFLDFKLINLSDTTEIIAQCEGNTDSNTFLSFPSSDKPMETFLTKILAAVQLDFQKDVLVLEKTATNNFSFGGFQKVTQIHQALFFGISPPEVGLQVNHQKYQAFTIGDCTFLFADTLEQINANQQLKKSLWTALQAIFKK